VEEVIQRFGVRPEQVVDVMGLPETPRIISRCARIGEKTAIQLIKAYGSIKIFWPRGGNSQKKLKENLKTYEDLARLSRQLATIHIDVPSVIG